MNAGRQVRMTSLALVILAAGCNDNDSEMAAAPLAMTITTPTSQPTFVTTNAEVTIGGTLSGMQIDDLFPGANGRVDNLDTGGSATIRIEGLGAWRTTSPMPLTFGTNRIHAFLDVRSGFADDSIVITRN